MRRTGIRSFVRYRIFQSVRERLDLERRVGRSECLECCSVARAGVGRRVWVWVQVRAGWLGGREFSAGPRVRGAQVAAESMQPGVRVDVATAEPASSPVRWRMDCVVWGKPVLALVWGEVVAQGSVRACWPGPCGCPRRGFSRIASFFLLQSKRSLAVPCPLGWTEKRSR
jgi:hypothetical protein